MAEVTTTGYWYPEGYPGRAFNLANVISVVYPTSDVTIVLVRFRASSGHQVTFDRTDFEDAYNAAFP